MTAEQKEILESIRDIISGDSGDDDVLELTDVVTTQKPEPKQPEAPAAEGAADKDILSEIDALLAEEPVKQSNSAAELANEVDFELASTNISPKEEFKMEEFKESLVSDNAAASASEAFKHLLDAAAEKKRSSIQTHPFRNGDTVEDIVAEMLKPLLKEWLDSNLPKMVQVLVEKEIKKLVPAE